MTYQFAKLTLALTGDVAGLKKTVLKEVGDPFCAFHDRLSSRNGFHVLGVDHYGVQAEKFEGVI